MIDSGLEKKEGIFTVTSQNRYKNKLKEEEYEEKIIGGIT